ncbi:glucokinase [bacterium]|nr:glucokinase [bacterium]
MLLAGDIGGTKTNLALFVPEAGLHSPVAEGTFPSRRYASLDAVVADFLTQQNHPPIERAVFGVAGPVVEGRAEVTNLPWLLEEQALARALKVDVVYLLNDLQSIASAVPVLDAGDVHTLHEGGAVPRTAIGVVAPGTGLGEAFLTWDSGHYRAHASEGGHTSFAPVDEEQMDLLRFLLTRFHHVSYERVCSGIGIPNLYAFYKETGRYPEPDWLAAEIAVAEDVTPVVVQNALARPDDCPICDATLKLFVSILGAEASNLALKVLATGGVYLGGGIPPRILPALADGRFMEAFLDKGRFADLLKDVPVHVILNPKVALMGAASYGLVMAA